MAVEPKAPPPVTHQTNFEPTPGTALPVTEVAAVVATPDAPAATAPVYKTAGYEDINGAPPPPKVKKSIVTQTVNDAKARHEAPKEGEVLVRMTHGSYQFMPPHGDPLKPEHVVTIPHGDCVAVSKSEGFKLVKHLRVAEYASE